MRIKYLLGFLLIFPLLLTAITAQSLPEGKWRLISYDLEGKIAHPLEGLEITLNVNPDGKLGGKSGCNTYGGSYGMFDGKLNISDIFSTKMFCGAETNVFESLYYGQLEKSTRVSLEKGKLTLTDPETKKFLEFAKVKKTKVTVNK